MRSESRPQHALQCEAAPDSCQWLQSIRDSATKAGTNITKLADNMSSWWANLDPAQHGSPSPEEQGRQSLTAQVAPVPPFSETHSNTRQAQPGTGTDHAQLLQIDGDAL